MNSDYDGYSLLLALPEGVELPQAVFNLFGPARTQPWALLMAPVAPEPDGRHVLEAVIHSRRQFGCASTLITEFQPRKST